MIMILSIDYEKKNKSDKIDNTWEASESKIKENVKSKWYIYIWRKFRRINTFCSVIPEDSKTIQNEIRFGGFCSGIIVRCGKLFVFSEISMI